MEQKVASIIDVVDTKEDEESLKDTTWRLKNFVDVKFGIKWVATHHAIKVAHIL